MPYVIIQKDKQFLLRNVKTGKVMKRKFKSREAAKNASRNYMKNKNKKTEKKSAY